jgi:hypothetical protein
MRTSADIASLWLLGSSYDRRDAPDWQYASPFNWYGVFRQSARAVGVGLLAAGSGLIAPSPPLGAGLIAGGTLLFLLSGGE